MLGFFSSGNVTSLGLYCERIALGQWQEPFNTFSALAFVCAGLLGLRLCFGSAKGDALRLSMALCTLVIGVVSFAFHMHGTRLSLIYDLLPILLFDVLAAWAILSRGLNMSAAGTLLTTLLIVATSFALTPIGNLYGFAFSGIEHTKSGMPRMDRKPRRSQDAKANVFRACIARTICFWQRAPCWTPCASKRPLETSDDEKRCQEGTRRRHIEPHAAKTSNRRMGKRS